MTNTQKHAERELEILIRTVPDAIVRDFVPEILALCEKFGESGQSGGSAPYTASALSSTIKKLCLFQPICPLQGTDDEWNDISESMGEKKMLQNNRLSSVFKHKESGIVSYSDAITWKTQKGTTWHGSAYLKDGTRVTSSQDVKSFPFEPKTFTIDIIEEEVAKDDWKFTIKNEGDLKKVFEYYKLN